MVNVVLESPQTGWETLAVLKLVPRRDRPVPFDRHLRSYGVSVSAGCCQVKEMRRTGILGCVLVNSTQSAEMFVFEPTRPLKVKGARNAAGRTTLIWRQEEISLYKGKPFPPLLWQSLSFIVCCYCWTRGPRPVEASTTLSELMCRCCCGLSSPSPDLLAIPDQCSSLKRRNVQRSSWNFPHLLSTAWPLSHCESANECIGDECVKGPCQDNNRRSVGL